MKVYLVIGCDYDTGYDLSPDSTFSPKAFLSRTDAEADIKKKGWGEIFEYEIDDGDVQTIENHPKIKEFREFVAGLECTKNDPLVRRFGHAITGIGTETGELLTEMKKTVFYGIHEGKINLTKVKDESCDLLHYFIMLTNILGITFDELIELNIAKLIERFPNGFSREAWLSRDKDKEREAMKEVDQSNKT